ncbi:MAG: glycoside hydrolase N-terminal domain-containing protein [Bacteroidales bacterium]|nr:glycoside hydrolase N-terminal domain-containing protein [Bacteroidales bacterium]
MKRYIIVVFCLLSVFSQAQMRVWFDKPTRSLDTLSFYDYFADWEWENVSLPIGNGSLGANVLGSVSIERLTLNEKSLWRGGPNVSDSASYYWNVNKNSAYLLDSIRKAFVEGDYSTAEKLTKQNFNGYAAYEEYNEKPFRFGSYTTLGEINIYTFLNEDLTKNYSRSLCIDSALARVEFENNGTIYQREYFASYPDSVIVFKFSANQKEKQNLRLVFRPNPESYIEVRPIEKNEVLFSGRLKGNEMEFALRLRVEAKNGKVGINDKGEISVKESDEVVFLLAGDTDYFMNFMPDFSDCNTYVGINPIETTKKTFERIEGLTYQDLKQRHLNDYCNLFNRVELNLNSNESFEDLPTDKRLERYRKGKADYGLEELYFQFGRYLTIASSRGGNLPSNLQGIWARGVDGPWRVDYHNNINLQMNYWLASPGNLLECNQPLIDYIRTLILPGRETAKAYYNARGWTASISSNIFGFTSPLASEDMSWNLSPMAGPWLALHIWDYYDYTRDKQYLENIAYDIIKESANFTVDYLWQRPDGIYTACPSTSPEHGPIDEGVTFANAVAKEILLCAIKASETLGKDKSQRKEWKKVLKNIMPYKIGRYGQLMEWSKDIDDPKDEHRHVNHLFGLHPGTTISPSLTPDLAEASKIVLNHRGDGATGWSMGWKLNLWARLCEGDRAYLLFNNLLSEGTLDNLWDSHPPFQIDGNFGASAGIVEMLLQSHLGFLQILPALPNAWNEGNVKGLLARGGFVVDIYWQKGELTQIKITSLQGEKCNIKYKDKELSFKTKKGRSYLIKYENERLIKNKN